MRLLSSEALQEEPLQQQESEGWTKRQRLLFLRSQVMFPMQTADFPTILAV